MLGRSTLALAAFEGVIRCNLLRYHVLRLALLNYGARVTGNFSNLLVCYLSDEVINVVSL